MTDEEFEAQLLHTHNVGISEGLRQAAEHIMQAAKDSFERFGTEERQTARLRHLANELHCKANAAHPSPPNEAAKGDAMTVKKRATSRPVDGLVLNTPGLCALCGWPSTHICDCPQCRDMLEMDKEDPNEGRLMCDRCGDSGRLVVNDRLDGQEGSEE